MPNILSDVALPLETTALALEVESHSLRQTGILQRRSASLSQRRIIVQAENHRFCAHSSSPKQHPIHPDRPQTSSGSCENRSHPYLTQEQKTQFVRTTGPTKNQAYSHCYQYQELSVGRTRASIIHARVKTEHFKELWVWATGLKIFVQGEIQVVMTLCLSLFLFFFM